MIILDSSAVLALILDEPGHDVVGQLGYRGLINAVNHSEVLAVLIDRDIPEPVAQRGLAMLQLDIVDFGEALSVRAGQLRASTKHAGLSLGDRACLAMAQEQALPVLTADRRWAELDLGIEVKLIR